jgi:F-type H+-transporting ATPase subunit b
MTAFFANPTNWVFIAFALFFILFGGKIWGALSGMLDERTATVKAELEEAAKLRREAEAMLKEAQASRDSALADAKALIDGARAEASRVAAAATAEAAAATARRTQMAEDRIAAAEKAAVDEVRQLAAEIATTAARQIIADGLTADVGARLIDTAIAQLPAALAARRAA